MFENILFSFLKNYYFLTNFKTFLFFFIYNLNLNSNDHLI